MNVISRFCRAVGGNTVLSFSAALPILLAAVGGGVDYVNLVRTQSDLQSIADGAALAGAKELRLAGARADAVVAVAENYARAAEPAPDLAFAGTVSADRNHIDVSLTRTVDFLLPNALSPLSATVKASAEAQAYGGAPACLMGLSTSESGTVAIDRASITAPSCAVYANATSSSAIEVTHSGVVSAALVCSAGGVDIASGSVNPTPRLDCPQSPDPMSSRPEPAVGACDHQDYRQSSVAVLSPGVYCGGLRLESGAVATLLPGTYVIKDGPLRIDNNASLAGTGVGFYFTGDGAVFDIDPVTIVSLTAPQSGPLAGILFFESRANGGNTFKIRSRDAPLLLGTFYLPSSALEVGAPGGLGLQKSDIGRLAAWTIIVARKVSISDGLNLTLNTDYAATHIPVPDGLGGSVALVR